MQESVSVLQDVQEFVSGNTSQVYIWMCNEIEGSYNKIIITIVPSCTWKKYHSFVAIGIVTCAGSVEEYQQLHGLHNTDGNKLMILSGIALYYGDAYIIMEMFSRDIFYQCKIDT